MKNQAKANNNCVTIQSSISFLVLVIMNIVQIFLKEKEEIKNLRQIFISNWTLTASLVFHFIF